MSFQPPENAPGSLAGRFTVGVFWSLAGTLGSRLSGFVVAIIAARLLGQAGFGELAMIQSTLGLLGTFTGFWLGATATRYVAALRAREPERTGRIIALTYLVSWVAGGAVALGCFLLAPFLAARTLNAAHLTGVLRLASLLLLVSTVCGPPLGILAGFQAFRTLARINWGQGLLSLPLTFILVWWGGLEGMLWALTLTALTGGLLAFRALAPEYRAQGIRVNLRQVWREKEVLWSFSLPTFLGDLIYTPVLWAANVWLANQPQGYVELGLFTAALQFQWLITAVNTILTPVTLPTLAEIHREENQEQFLRVFTLNCKLNWGLALVMGFLALGLSPWLMRLFGANFQRAATILPLTICFNVIYVAYAINWQAFYSSGRMWLALAITLSWGLILLATGFLLIPAYGGRGLAAAFLIAYLAGFILQLAILNRLLAGQIIDQRAAWAGLALLASGLFLSTHDKFIWFNVANVIFAIFLLAFIIYDNSELLRSLITTKDFHDYCGKVRVILTRRCL